MGFLLLAVFRASHTAIAAIVYRILHAANAKGSKSRVLYRFAHILAESGILYTAMTIFSLIGGVFDVIDSTDKFVVVSDLADTAVCLKYHL